MRLHSARASTPTLFRRGITASSVAATAVVERPPLPEATVGVGQTTRHLAELDSLRGIAIGLVYLFHLRPRLWAVAPKDIVVSLPGAFVHAGHTGVSLFFILSGFLLSLPFLEEAAGGRRVDRRRYFERRALRILPLYYVFILAAAVLTSSHLADLARALPYLVFANSVHGLSTPLRPYTNVLWSLATEVQFYVVLPLLPLLVARRTRLLGAIALLTYAYAYSRFLDGGLSRSGPGFAIPYEHSLFGRGWTFLFGIAAAWIVRRHGERLRAAMHASSTWRNGGADALLLATILALAVLLQWVARGGYFPMETPPRHAWHLVEGPLWTAVLLLLLLAPLRAKRIWSNPALSHLGVLSYSVYLLHVPFLAVVLPLLRPWLLRSEWYGVAGVFLPTIALLGLCEASYRLIERPFLVRKARLAS